MFDREAVSELVRCAAEDHGGKIEYNEDRPHSSLGNCTPKEFVAAQAAGVYETERCAGHFRTGFGCAPVHDPD